MLFGAGTCNSFFFLCFSYQAELQDVVGVEEVEDAVTPTSTASAETPESPLQVHLQLSFAVATMMLQ